MEVRQYKSKGGREKGWIKMKVQPKFIEKSENEGKSEILN